MKTVYVVTSRPVRESRWALRKAFASEALAEKYIYIYIKEGEEKDKNLAENTDRNAYYDIEEIDLVSG